MWFDAHCVWLKSLKIDIPKMNPSDVTFRFVHSNALPVMGQSHIPVCFQSEWVDLVASIIDAPPPAPPWVKSP